MVSSKKGVITKQVELILSSRQHAFLYALVFALLPYTSWLAMVVVALVTLRKGEHEGGRLVLGVMVAHTLVSLVSQAPLVAIANTSIFFVPGFIAACTLRVTSAWLAVAAALFLQVLIGAVVIQLLIPEWIGAQYAVILSILKASQPDQVMSKWLSDPARLPDMVMANYAFGVQLMTAVLSILLSLMMARALQAKVCNPGGFAQEMLTFRGNRFSFLLMLVLLVGAWQWNSVAMNVLPVLALFYLMAGLSLCASLLINKVSRFLLVILLLPLILLPFVMAPLYVFLGMLDSVFNIRLAFCR
ncbi:MAG: hypothetical protein NXI01_07760 [Gammaproteobacteria bacterium]|nr:hypothetical protein [Gammaproteobacteria bacterium]